jgi:cobalt-zinc-cadmium efflux system membrane fusion protein
MKPIHLVFSVIFLLSLNMNAEVHASEGDDHHDDEAPLMATTLSDAAITNADFVVTRASSGQLRLSQTLFGVIAPVIDQQTVITAPYLGLITQVLVNVGDQVQQDDPLVRIRNAASGAEYTLSSPLTGVVTERYVNRGEFAERQALLEVSNLEQVWVELSAFPEAIETLRVGQTAEVYDLHQHERVNGKVFYIAPHMTGGHIARARVQLPNPEGHWRPGMHVKADITTDLVEVPIVVPKTAVQTLRGEAVVFEQQGNTFTARTILLGRSDASHVEVLSGLTAGVPYVTQNSYLLKADILKAGAGHHH